MDLIFKLTEDWKLSHSSTDIQQYDNLTDRIIFTGYIPEEFDRFNAQIKFGNSYDEIPLVANGCTLTATLTASHLAHNGIYEIQIKAESGEKVKHSNVIYFGVNRSLSGDAVWPVIPTAFTEAVRQAEEAAANAEESKEQAKSARDSAVISQRAAEEAAENATNQANYAAGIMGLAVFEIDTEDGNLYVTYPTPYYGATFAINQNGYLEVTT